MTIDDDILFNFKSCYSSLLINAESDFKTGRESNLLRNLEFFKQKDINENLSNRTLQILQSEHRNGNEHFLRTFLTELEDIQRRIERVRKDNKGNIHLNQMSIATSNFVDVLSYLNSSLDHYSTHKRVKEKGLEIQLSKLTTLVSNLEIRHELDSLFDNTSDQRYLLEYLKYEFLPKRKARHKADSEMFNGMLRIPRRYEENRTECIEEWLKEKIIFSEARDQEIKVIRLQPTTFEDIFYRPEDSEICLNILRELDPPVIDVDNNFIGKLKGVVCVWIDELQKQGFIRRQSDRNVYASLIPKKIKNFSIDSSMFGKPHPRAENSYQTEIKLLLSQIKRSQDSQEGKLGK